DDPLSEPSSPSLPILSTLNSSTSFSSPASPPLSSSDIVDTILDGFLQAIQDQETAGGADFLSAQSDIYDQVFQKYFDCECDCPYPHELNEPEHTHTLQERTEYLQRSLPSLPDIFGEHDSYDPRAFFSQWQTFLSNQPTEPLSFRKTQATLPQHSITVTRQWDVDSIWLGATNLSAIQPPNDFHLSFLPSYSRNLTTNQVIQPHGLDLANTRHIPFGYFNTKSVRFSAFLFFPNAARSRTSASSNSLSDQRQRDLYDTIIIPAAYETVRDPLRQEIPRTYDIAYAKSRSYQEKPSTGPWRAEDESRSFRLTYTLPAEDLERFWKSVVSKANALQIPTRRGDEVAYFRNPRLLFQAHDLKNTFARPTLEEALSLFQETALGALDPTKLDIHSCWLDIGMRDYVSSPPSQDLQQAEPYTLLWKSHCHRRLHERLLNIAPDTTLQATYFRSFLLRDAGTYTSKVKPTRTANLGHSESRQLGIPRAKAYNCNKEIYSVIYNDYYLFSSPSLPYLALQDNLIQDLSTMSRDRQRAHVVQLNRASLFQAWEANKRHLRAISDPQALTNYGIRKEVTFRLDTILTMFNRGFFHPDQSPCTGPITRVIPLCPKPQTHYPLWVIPTKTINTFIFTQAARLVLPLDHLFQEATSLNTVGQPIVHNPAESSVRQILALYTAQLFCRLLIHALSSERELNYDKWIWNSVWRVRSKGGTMMERRGLGLEGPIAASGMSWIPPTQFDWGRGHIALETLVQLYIPRSPLQSRVASQTNIQSLTTSQLTVEFVLQEWLQDARRAFCEGREQDGRKVAGQILKLCAEEIARAYYQHLLSKMKSYWDRVRDGIGRANIPKLTRLQQAQKDAAVEKSKIVTAQTIWEVYMEAWAEYAARQPANSLEGDSMPSELPYWMTTRKYLPPKDS
ncbi:hypothetical protein BGZ63DRAFT_435853, partial [Mariannaea sp. PMI_226]